MLTALFLGAICGLIGAFAMTFFMGAVSQAFSKRVDMARALGSYFTGKAEGSGALGRAIHSFFRCLFWEHLFCDYACDGGSCISLCYFSGDRLRFLPRIDYELHTYVFRQ